MVDTGLNTFVECAAECVHLCPQEEECTYSSWGDSKMYTPDTISNYHRKSDNARHLKTFRTISNFETISSVSSKLLN